MFAMWHTEWLSHGTNRLAKNVMSAQTNDVNVKVPIWSTKYIFRDQLDLKEFKDQIDINGQVE